jgi:large subunit ribosomal protein L23
MKKVDMYKVLLSPHVSDKAYRVADQSKQIVFKVAKDATKCDIKKAVETLFEVKVAEVNTVNVKGKKRNFGRMQGATKAWKKAYVKLAPGFDINFANAE